MNFEKLQNRLFEDLLFKEFQSMKLNKDANSGKKCIHVKIFN